MNPKSEGRKDGENPPKIAAPETVGTAGGRQMLPVWFFVGIIFLVYGVIILAVGISEIHNPPHTVLAAQLHPSLWWGGLLIIVGAVFAVRSRRKRG